MINKLILIVSFCILSLYFLWVSQNWRNPKLVEVLPVLVGVIVTITFSIISVPQVVKGDFEHKYFTNKKGTQSLNFARHPILKNIFKYHTDISSYIDKNQNTFDLKSPKGSVGFVSFVILSYLTQSFHTVWHYNGKTNEDDIEQIELNKLPKSIKESIFFQNLVWHAPFDRISLPKNTKIIYYPPSHFQDVFPPKAEIHLIKRTFFNLFQDFHIVITVQASRGTVGLGEIGRYVGLISPGKRAIDLGDEEISKYWNVTSNVSYEAEFGRFRPWSKECLIYREWAEDILDNLKANFSWDLQDAKVRDYLQVTSYEKIIHQMK